MFERSVGTETLPMTQDCEDIDPFRIPFRCSEVFIAFNWFSPTGIWDYLSLGLRLLVTPGRMDKEFGLCSEFAMTQATRFMNDPGMWEFLHELNLGYVPKVATSAQRNCVLDHHQRQQQQANGSSTVEGLASFGAAAGFLHRHILHGRKVTLTGFSMGGSIAHAFAFLLKESKNLPQDIRVVGFGAPRPGNDELTRWFHTNLTPDSLNVILASEEPVALGSSNGGDPSLPVPSEDNEAVVSTPTLTQVPPEGPTDCQKCNPRVIVTPSACVGQGFGCLPVWTSPASSPVTGAAIAFIHDETEDDPIQNPTMLLYDPVTRSPSSLRGFDVHPNAYVIVQQRKGIMTHVTDFERERLKAMDDQSSAETSTISALVGIAVRGSPFSVDVSRGLDKLHSILKYYDALCYDNDNQC